MAASRERRAGSVVQNQLMLHVFDMDGTLLHGTSANEEIARELGRSAEIQTLDEALIGGEISAHDYAAAVCDVLYHDLTDETVHAVFHRSPWLHGMADVVADITARGERCAVITMSPLFFADKLRDAGFGDVHGAAFPQLPMGKGASVAGILTRGDKVRITAELLTRYDLDHDRCIAYGDSATDVPLFRFLRKTVAVNATRELSELATVSLRGTDLWAIYQGARATFQLDSVSPTIRQRQSTVDSPTSAPI